jgi:hypothetical protein
MDIPTVVASQFHAALDMLEQAVTRCPAALWDDPADKNRFWQIAYHTLFYVHLYLQPTEADFIPWARHRPGMHDMDPPDTEQPVPPYTQADVLDYVAVCRNEVDRLLPVLDLTAASGFYWLPFDKLELQLYSIRHIMLHAGELCERLGARAQIEIGWVGRRAAGPRAS